MKRIQRILSALLTLLLVVGTLIPAIPHAKAATISTSTFNTKVQTFIADARWKNGIAWGDSQSPKLSGWSSKGCCAYAADFAAYVYGSTNAAWTGAGFTKFTNINEIRAGDIIHTSNHWFVVLSRDGNNLKTAEGNFDDKVRISTDGWGIKNGKIYNLKATDGERTFVYGYHYNFSDSSTQTGSATQVYYNIDMSAEVLNSRTNQQVSGDCAVVSMATVEAFMHRATSTADKKTVYNALVSKNGDNDYAYWSNCGYVSYDSINWDTVYDQLACGYPVIVHRPAVGSKAQHWAVVAGYKGSTTTLQKDKFVIVDVYHGTGGTDIYTSASWASGTTIDRMVTRKNGIAVTSLSGIKLAINHPAVVHPYGAGHGVFGYITSNTTLTSVQVMVTNLSTGSNMINKTVNPNAKSYSLFDLDSEITFAKYPEGEYFYTVIANTATGSASAQYYFTIDATWPSEMPTRKLTFEYDLGGGVGTVPEQTVNHGDILEIPTAVPTKTGYTFKGWNVQRNDGRWYCSNLGWYTTAQVEEYDYVPKLYIPGESYGISYAWMKGGFTCQEFTFYAVWEENEAEPTLTGIQVSSKPAKLSYEIGQELDTAGLAITATYSDGSTKTVTEGFTTSGFSSETAGIKTVTVKYSGLTTTFTVTVNEPEPDIDENAPQIVLESKKVTRGSTFAVTVELKNNPGFSYLEVTPQYDSALTLVSVENGDLISDFTKGRQYVWVSDEDMTDDGLLLTFTFSTAEDLEAGNYRVNFLVRTCANYGEQPVNLAVVPGNIEVIDFVYGDATGDGTVDGFDVIRLKKYLANYDYDAETSTTEIGFGADANGDGKVDGFDVIRLKKYLADYDYETGDSSVVLGPQ